MRSIADQTEAELGGTWSVLVRQKRDHVRLDALLEELASPAADETDVLHRIARLVFPHAFAEEAVLWPILRRSLPDGESLTLRVEEEHQEVNELWTRLEDTADQRSGRTALITRLTEVLRQDVRDEEDALLPRLQEAVDPKTLRLAGIAWEATRRTAPTRPHPVVARRPPGNALSALPLSVLDRTRDRLESLARRGPARVRPAARGASRLVARGAGRVERVGVLRRGERPSTHRL